MKLTHRWVDPGFQELWDEIGRRPGDWDADQEGEFYEETSGLWPSLYDWLLHSLIVRDAVSAFEIYLEKVSAEVLAKHQFKWQCEDGRSPQWGVVVGFFKTILRVKVETGRIKTVRTMRNILTHQRGELQTKEHRMRFGGYDDSLPDNAIRLAEHDVTEILDDLAQTVQKVDEAARPFVEGTERLDLARLSTWASKADGAGHDDSPPAHLAEALEAALARWHKREPSPHDDLDTGEAMASAITEFLAWSSDD